MMVWRMPGASHWLKNMTTAVFFSGLTMTGTFSSAAVWDYYCQSTIDSLSTAQQDVESAHRKYQNSLSELEDAKSSYSFCSPSLYGNCEFERMRANEAVDDYNDAVRRLKSTISDFNSYVSSFSSSCLG
jgi:hypothetical protein